MRLGLFVRPESGIGVQAVWAAACLAVASSVDPPLSVDRGGRSGERGVGGYGAAAGAPAPTQEASTPSSAPVRPFLDFRDRSLETNRLDAGPTLDARPFVPVGWFGPADPADPASGGLWWAASAAFEVVNQGGGIHGRPVHLIACWTDDVWASGAAQLFRTIYEQRLVALLGSIDGPTTHLAEQVVAKARLPLLSAVSTDKSVNLAGVPWMFSLAPSDDAIAPVLVEAALERAGARGEVVLIHATDHDSRLLTREIVRALGARRRTPEYQFALHPGTPDLGAHLDAVARAGPSAILLIADAPESARWIRELRLRGIGAPVFAGPALGRLPGPDPMLADEPTSFYPSLTSPDFENPSASDFQARFRERYGRDPHDAEWRTYDAARLLITVLRAGGTDPGSIREGLIRQSPWLGITGWIEWDGTGQNIRRNIRIVPWANQPRTQSPGAGALTSSADRSSSVPAK